MLAVAHQPLKVSFRRMSETISADAAERQLLGRVLKQLRTRAGLTQPEAAERLGQSAQSWQRYEAGERQFTPALLGKLARALNLDPEEFELERARLLDVLGPAQRQSQRQAVAERSPPGFTIPVWGRVRASEQGPQVYDAGEPEHVIEATSLFGPSTGALRMAGESMIPWGEPGELIIFDRNSYPRRGHGCVIETVAGEYYVKLYEGSAGGLLMVKELFPEERTVNFMTADIKGVYAVRLRGD